MGLTAVQLFCSLKTTAGQLTPFKKHMQASQACQTMCLSVEHQYILLHNHVQRCTLWDLTARHSITHCGTSQQIHVGNPDFTTLRTANNCLLNDALLSNFSIKSASMYATQEVFDGGDGSISCCIWYHAGEFCCDSP